MATTRAATMHVDGWGRYGRRSPGSRAERRAGWICLAGGGLVVLFWCLYLAGPLAPSASETLVRSFESAFPVADGVLAITLFGTAAGLLRGRLYGTFLLTAAGAMCLYLGLLDATFYGVQMLRGSASGPAVAVLVAPGLCLGGGTWALLRSWTLWSDR